MLASSILCVFQNKHQISFGIKPNTHLVQNSLPHIVFGKLINRNKRTIGLLSSWYLKYAACGSGSNLAGGGKEQLGLESHPSRDPPAWNGERNITICAECLNYSHTKLNTTRALCGPRLYKLVHFCFKIKLNKLSFPLKRQKNCSMGESVCLSAEKGLGIFRIFSRLSQSTKVGEKSPQMFIPLSCARARALSNYKHSKNSTNCSFWQLVFVTEGLHLMTEIQWLVHKYTPCAVLEWMR